MGVGRREYERWEQTVVTTLSKADAEECTLHINPEYVFVGSRVLVFSHFVYIHTEECVPWRQHILYKVNPKVPSAV